jgi:uncharacterized membrane protein YfcA
LTADPVWAGLLFLLVAGLYASVGQAGASGYLAVMSFLGMEPAPMKVTALSLNLLVAAIATLQFARLGLLSLRTFYPFAVLGFPFSLLGGAVQLPASVYYPAVGAILLLSSAQMVRTALRPAAMRPLPPARPPLLPSLLAGAVIGFVSGTTGTGGGIFLAPVILAMNWVGVRRTAAVTAAYNLLNSAAALVGAHAILGSAPPALPGWLLAVAAGGTAGALVGSRHLPDRALRLILAALLTASGLQLLLL